MRPIDPAERALLAGNHSQHQRWEIQNASGSWIDLTPFHASHRVEKNVDQPVASASLELVAEGGATDSLHPLRSDSTRNVDDVAAYAPLIYTNRRIRWRRGTGLPGAAAPAFPWLTVFEGITEQPASPDRNRVTVGARDLGKVLLDRYIEKHRFYGSARGVPVEVVMAQILADNSAGLPISITLTMPGGAPPWVWAIKKYEQDRVPVLDALRTLAQQIGWDVRYRWNGNTPELQFYEPDRAKTAPDWTLPPDEYLTVDELAFDDSQIRNAFALTFFDENLGGQQRTLYLDDAASIAAHGRQYMEISERDAFGITTVTEATRMLNAMRSDLATPFIDQLVTSFDLPFAECGDLIRFPANSAHYNQDQAFAPVSITHSCTTGDNGQKVMKIALRTRGKPAGAFSDWIRKFGLGPKGMPLPAPYIGPLIGEESEGGGVSGDGAVWQEIRFERNTQYIHQHYEEREALPVPVPEVTENSRGWILERPAGDFRKEARFVDFSGVVKPQRGTLSKPYTSSPGQATQDWWTYCPSATRPRWFKRSRSIPYNWTGVPGKEIIHDAVQAVDPVPAVDGIVEALTVETMDGYNNIHVDVGAIDPNFESHIFLVRDSVVLIPLYIGYNGNQRWTIVDQGIDTSQPMDYSAFIWTQGVSGAHVSGSSGTGPTPPATPAPGAINWVDPTPDLVTINAVPHVRAGYIHNASWATRVILQASADGIIPYVDVLEQRTTAKLGELHYKVTVPAWLRLRVANNDDSLTNVSTERLFTLNVPPVPPPNAIRMVNGSPKLDATGTAVQIEYQNTRSGTDHVALMRSLDGINGWAEVDTDVAANGTFLYSASLAAAYFQVLAHDAAHVTIAASAVGYWNGGTAPPVLDSPPVFTAAPRVIDVLGVPTVELTYDSNISWFGRMALMVSHDGQTYAEALSSIDPGSVFLYQPATSPVWFQLRAENSNDTQRLYSAAVYFAGTLVPGGGTAPELTLSVQNSASGVPRLRVHWTCDNPQAVRVTIEKAPSVGGVPGGFAEVDDSASVAVGYWEGNQLEEAFYRGKAWDVNDQLLATSSEEYWAGQIYVAG